MRDGHLVMMTRRAGLAIHSPEAWASVVIKSTTPAV
jgi:hypothetical protein